MFEYRKNQSRNGSWNLIDVVTRRQTVTCESSIVVSKPEVCWRICKHVTSTFEACVCVAAGQASLLYVIPPTELARIFLFTTDIFCFFSLRVNTNARPVKVKQRLHVQRSFSLSVI